MVLKSWVLRHPTLFRFLETVRDIVAFPLVLSEQKKLLYQVDSARLRDSHPNPLNRYGRKAFSQTDEDGITLEVIRRLGLEGAGTYGELGVGTGLENNTLILAAMGWRGFWLGGEKLAFRQQESPNFLFRRTWITVESVVKSVDECLRALQIDELDVLSIDLDGNDLYVARRILDSGRRPRLVIIEYNAKFIPPMRFCMDYDPEHVWRGDDYFGASLQSLSDMFREFGYALVCCNSATGSNAFFVMSSELEKFQDVPNALSEIWSAPRYVLNRSYGHRQSLRTIKGILYGQDFFLNSDQSGSE